MENNIIMNPNFNIIEEEPEIWVEKKPAMGDHIRVNRGLYCHHGIYISDSEVIHFTGNENDSILDWSKPEVISSDLDYFLKGDTLEVKEYTDDELEDLYPVDHIVQYARTCLGDKGYNLVFNNCEHFANTCTLGRFRSKQVEKVFSTLFDKGPVVYGGKNMGLIRKGIDFVKGLFGGNSGGGSRSTSNTNTTYNYEPDKVKIAEIEANAQIRLAELDKDRVELIKNSQIELLEFNANCEIAIREANARSLSSMAQSIANFQTQLNEVTAKRLEIIEKGSISIVKEIEEFYKELENQIDEDNYKYSLEKMPKLLELLEQYEEGSTAHKLYAKRIQDDMQKQVDHYSLQIESVKKRQNHIIAAFLKSRDTLIGQTNNMSQVLIDTFQDQIKQNNQLSSPQNNKDNILKLENKNNKLLNE